MSKRVLRWLRIPVLFPILLICGALWLLLIAALAKACLIFLGVL